MGRVDLLVGDPDAPLTLIETKFRIIFEYELEAAVAQAKSYALMLGLASFVVASPEAIWIYSLERNRENLEIRVSLEDFADKQAQMFDALYALQTT